MIGECDGANLVVQLTWGFCMYPTMQFGPVYIYTLPTRPGDHQHNYGLGENVKPERHIKLRKAGISVLPKGRRLGS